MVIEHSTNCGRGFLSYGFFAYAYYVDCFGECLEMNDYSKSNSKDLVNYIKRRV